MKTKEDFINKLRSDDMFKYALSQAKTDKERAEIASVVEGVVSKFADVLVQVVVQAETDPDFVEELKRALLEGEQVITDSELVTSGSTNANAH